MAGLGRSRALLVVAGTALLLVALGMSTLQASRGNATAKPATPAEIALSSQADSCSQAPGEPTDTARAKSCKDRPWCKSTYNGLPRVSCNPCCYGNLGVPMICFD